MSTVRRTKSLAGLDLNGLQDFLARAFEHASDEEKTEHCKQVGWRSVAVRIDDRENLGDAIAGPQAERSCYGRGVGFGEHVGDPRRRIELQDVWRRIENGEWEEPDDEIGADEDLDSPVLLRTASDEVDRPHHAQPRAESTLLRADDGKETEWGVAAPQPEQTREVEPQPVHPLRLGEALRASVLSAAPGAQRVSVVVSDIPDLDETAQTWLLTELARTKLQGCTVDLLWRPVAVVLGALSENGAGQTKWVLEDLADRQSKSIRIAVLVAGVRGIEVQKLLLRSWKEQLLPERKGHGLREPWNGDWTARRQAVLRHIQQENGREAAELIYSQTRLIERMAAGNSDALEVDETEVRDDHGRWSRIEIVRPAPTPDEPLPEGVVRTAREAEYVLLFSPAGGAMTRALERGLTEEGIAAEKILGLGQ